MQYIHLSVFIYELHVAFAVALALLEWPVMMRCALCRAQERRGAEQEIRPGLSHSLNFIERLIAPSRELTSTHLLLHKILVQ